MTSIQKVLNPRKKTPTELESEQFEKNQYNHISKALNSLEGAPKEKHIRAIILGTFHYAGASIFFKHSNLHNLQSNPISCWKYLYAMHKIMRDGHEQVMKDILRNERYIKELNNLWGHLKSGYGTIIASFCKLLTQKLRFHKKYRQIPGNLILANDEALYSGRSNDYVFELSLDTMDYMDELVSFQQSVINSLDKSKSNSMTAQGQCRLTPLIQVIQDMATLYDLCVRLLFRLHTRLDVELLADHRRRFMKLFNSIKAFFKQAQTFQYFKTLIQVPTLPNSPPNFMVESDLVAQQALVVNVNEESDNDLNNAESPPDKPNPLIDFDQANNDNRFDQLFGQMDAFNFSDNERNQMQKEIDYLKAQIERIKAEYSEKVNSLLARIRVLEEEVKGLVQLKDLYEERIREYESHKCDANSTDKFNKIKEAYAKLRDEHVKVLRQQGELQKHIDTDKKELEKLQNKLDEHMESYAVLERDNLLHSSREKNNDQCKEELAEAQSKLKVCERTKFELMAKSKNMESKNSELQKEMERLQSEWELRKDGDTTKLANLESELQTIRSELAQQQSGSRLAEQRLKHLQEQLDQERAGAARTGFVYDNLVRASCAASETLIKDTWSRLDKDAEQVDKCRVTPDAVFHVIEDTLTEIGQINELLKDSKSSESRIKLANSINKFGHLISNCLVQGRIFNNDGEDLQDKMRVSLDAVQGQSVSLLQSIANDQDNLNWSQNLQQTLAGMRSTAEQIRDRQLAALAQDGQDLFDEELRNTRNAIDLAEERFKMLLAETRSRFSGVQLEVNERILDSCSELMFAIKVLIDRSKTMQAEIVRDGKGSGSVKEFYKKHHKWTEGLISAAKSVGGGAMWLCEAADNLVSKDGKFEELIVCSRDITASTTQLVVSSRVKANPTSSSLNNLCLASKDVSSATGKVIANARNAVSVLEEKGSYDFSNLSLTQARRLEMDSQVKVLELESDLEKERRRLGDIRKMHYQLAGDLGDEA